MREALAAAGHDFVLTGPASKLKHLRDTLLAAKRRGLGRRGRHGRRYLSMLAGVFLATAAAGILLNALVWQKTRHPAPLFSRALPAVTAKEARIAGGIASPMPRRAPQAVAPGEARETPPEKPLARKPPVEKPAPGMPAGGGSRQPRDNAAPERPRDQISELLQAAHAPPSRPSDAASTPAAPSKPVQAAQRALVKLGFVLKPDGVAGAATRQAIKRYERDRGLPVRGDLTPALMRRLGAETAGMFN